MRGVILDIESLGREDLHFDGVFETLDHWDVYDYTESGQVAERIRRANVVISNKVVVDRVAMETSKDLRLICVAATGTNNIDLEAAQDNEVTVTNVRAYGTPSVVEHLFAGLLTLYRRLDEYRGAVVDGRWQTSRQFCVLDSTIRQLAGSRIGIVGYGELGQGVAAVAEAFGMEVCLAQRPGGEPVAGRMPLEQLLPTVDVLSLHCPLNDQTRGLIGIAELKRMRSDAVLINLARGGIVIEQDLVTALREKIIAGAVVDVLGSEPPVAGNPLLQPAIPNLILTPHVAWASRSARQRLIDELEKNILAFMAGSPRNLV